MDKDKTALPFNHESPQEKTLGLKEQREGRGISLKDIFEATRISIQNLEALEDEDFGKLPPPIYTRNFIDKYAQTTGIDARQLQARYSTYLANASKPIEPGEVQKPWPARRLKYWLIYGSLALLLAVGAIVLALFLSNGDKQAASSSPAVESAPPPETTQPPAKSVPAPAANEPQTAALPAGTGTATGATPATNAVPAPEKNAPAPDKYHLSIKARELTWIRIIIDKTNTSEVMLKPGERIEREAAKGFRLEIGNAGGIDVSFQQQPLGPLGKRGEVVAIELPPVPEKKQGN